MLTDHPLFGLISILSLTNMWESHYRITFLEKLQMVMEPRRFGRILEIPSENIYFQLIQKYPSVKIIGTVPGSTGQIYTIILDMERGEIYHDCPDYLKNPRICKHIGAFLKELPYLIQDRLIDWISEGTYIKWNLENKISIDQEIEHYLNGPIISDLYYLFSVQREVSANISEVYLQEIILKVIQFNPIIFFQAIERISSGFPSIDKFFDCFPAKTQDLFFWYMDYRKKRFENPISSNFYELFLNYIEYSFQKYSIENESGVVILL